MQNLASPKAPSRSRIITLAALVTLTGTSMLLVLSGCGGPDPTSMIPSNTANMANAGNIKTELLETSALQTIQRINPFESQLPGQQVKLPDAPSGGGEPNLAEGLPGLPDLPAEEVKDPFSGLEIGGIVFQKKSPMAILRSNGGNSNGLGGVVRQGDSFVIDDVKVIVAKIDKSSVTLKAPSLPNGSNSRILTVPSLIGYASTPNSAGAGATPTSRNTSGAALQGATPTALAEIDRMENNIDVPQAIMDLLKDKMQQNKTAP